MTSFGSDWHRFADRHLGNWQGRAMLVNPSAKPLHSVDYSISCSAVSPSTTNRSVLLLETTISTDQSNRQSKPSLRYDLSAFHVFLDGAYSAEHTLLDLPLLLPPEYNLLQSAIELALPVSATERVRSFLLYDKHRTLVAILLLEEVRSHLFDTRAPLALTSLVGEWRGQSETFRHTSRAARPAGFGSPTSPTARAKRVYSHEDVPDELKHPSSTDDGLLKTNTLVRFGWDPPTKTVRRATDIQDMQNNHLGRSVVYGVIDESGLFDVARFDSSTPSETLLIALNNACFVAAPLNRVQGVPISAELGCLVTAGFRRRIVRMYGPKSVASETLTSETLLQH